MGNPQLTLADMELARRQCELQHATSQEQIRGMVQALEAAKQVAFSQDPLHAQGITNLVLRLGRMVEPGKADGWRRTPVTFQGGDMGEAPGNIERAITSWAEAFADGRLDPTELYYYFERIHPFEDGNGRVGHCLWALAVKHQTGEWPEALPPDLFGGSLSLPAKSAFGDIEAS